MPKVTKTIKISVHHEEWLQSNNINFSKWIRDKIDEEVSVAAKLKTEKTYKAVILAAGKDTNLFPLTENIPKALLDIKGKTILQRQVETLHSAGIYEIAVVRGYKKDKINYPHLAYFDNDEFENSGNLLSLFCAREFMDNNTIVLYGDILFETEVLKRLMEEKNNTTLVVDRGWKKRYNASREGHPFPPELTTVSDKGKDIEIKSIGTGLPETNATSEFIGLASLSPGACACLKEIYKKIYSTNKNQHFHNAESIQKASFIDFIQELLDRKEKVSALEIWRNWIEVDTFEDYRLAWNLIDELNRNRE